MSEIGVIDYGAGNIASVMNAVDYAGADAELVSDPDKLENYEKLILPGVGAAGQAIQKLRDKHLDEALHETVIKNGKPMMGICVGLHLLAEKMYEFGEHDGLGWIKGKVISLKDHNIQTQPVPHMGWSDVELSEDLKNLSKQLGRHTAFYFAHSYALVCDQPDIVSTTVQYDDQTIHAGVAFDNVCAFQFHPEKSQVAGDILMQWFLDWEP